MLAFWAEFLVKTAKERRLNCLYLIAIAYNLISYILIKKQKRPFDSKSPQSQVYQLYVFKNESQTSLKSLALLNWEVENYLN